jgi:hypothetical protein
MEKWDVWSLDQQSSRVESEPGQPLDPTKPRRRFLILSDNAHLRNAKAGTKILCSPLGGHSQSSLFDLPVKTGEAGCTKDCHVWLSEIYTLKFEYFKQLHGSLKHREDEIKLKLKKLLAL